LPQQQLVLLDTNAAIVSQLKQIQQTKQKFGTKDPGSALAARFAVSGPLNMAALVAASCAAVCKPALFRQAAVAVLLGWAHQS
jgi:hypothetical protein